MNTHRLKFLIKRELYHLKRIFGRRFYVSPDDERRVVDDFHRLYYEAHMFGQTWADTKWMGVPLLKCPLDLWLYQEILFELKPKLIIETGTAAGGSALYLAHLCDLLQQGEIITIDIEARDNRPQHPRITYLTGSSTDENIFAQVRSRTDPLNHQDHVLVILDSDHRCEHVITELEMYSPFVRKGGYLIVEDTNLNGHPVEPDSGPGPWEAVEAFLTEHPEFQIDRSKEKFLLSFNPRGYLKRVR